MGRSETVVFDLYSFPVFLLPFPSCWGFVNFENLAWRGFGHLGCGGLEITWPFDSATPLLFKVICWQVRLSLSVQKFSTFFFWLEIAIGLKFWFFYLCILGLLRFRHINETPKGHFLASNRIIWAIMRVCAKLGSAGMRFKEIFF